MHCIPFHNDSNSVIFWWNGKRHFTELKVLRNFILKSIDWGRVLRNRQFISKYSGISSNRSVLKSSFTIPVLKDLRDLSIYINSSINTAALCISISLIALFKEYLKRMLYKAFTFLLILVFVLVLCYYYCKCVI